MAGRRPGSAEGDSQARVVRANREQVLLRPTDLESLLPPEHRARAVWEFVQGLDLSSFYAEIESVEGRAGRPAIDPAILLSLWLYATVEGVGSARALARLCEQHHAYQWLCGGVSVRYRTLSSFRVQHVEKLDELLTGSVATLVHAGLVQLKRVAQDGMRVRASAGAASFRKRSTLKRCLRDARAQVKALKQELEDDPAAMSRRESAARLQAAEDRRRRVQAALEATARLQAPKKSKKAKRHGGGPPSQGSSGSGSEEPREPRASTTDPEARVMRFADGGYRPGVNMQLAATVGSQVIVGVDVSNSGSDYGHLEPMLQQLEDRYGGCPESMLVDGGFARLEDIERAAEPSRACKVYAPPMTPRKPRAARRPLRGDSPALAAWRRRMASWKGKEVYRQRAATAECVNALARNRGLRQLTVRGLHKAKAVLLWFALGHNMLRALSLRAEAARTA
ncbi:MAG: IS1182 family transposase [Planctomycetota bacterium]